MATFLQILGAIFLTLIILGVVLIYGGKFWLRYKLNTLKDQLHQSVHEARMQNQGSSTSYSSGEAKSESGQVYDYEELQKRESTNHVTE